MKLPTTSQCLEYFNQYKVPSNIKEHCLMVNRLALFLAQKLNHHNTLNLELINCVSLLHDLFKAVTFEDLKPHHHFKYFPTEEEIKAWKQLKEKYTGLHESEISYLVFKDQFPELALAIKNSSDPLKKDKTPEEIISHYADWRIYTRQIVTLSERLQDLKQRYTKGDEYWNKRRKIILEEEQKLFSQLDFLPAQLKQKFEEDNHGR